MEQDTGDTGCACSACSRQKGAGMGNATTKPTCPWTSLEHPSCASATHDCLLPSPCAQLGSPGAKKAAPRPGSASVGRGTAPGEAGICPGMLSCSLRGSGQAWRAANTNFTRERWIQTRLAEGCSGCGWGGREQRVKNRSNGMLTPLGPTPQVKIRNSKENKEWARDKLHCGRCPRVSPLLVTSPALLVILSAPHKRPDVPVAPGPCTEPSGSSDPPGQELWSHLARCFTGRPPCL